MLAVVGERRRHGHAERRLADRDVDAEPREGPVQPLVERGHREPVDERERLRLAAVRPHDEAVVDEVEVDLEDDAVRAGRRRVVRPRTST